MMLCNGFAQKKSQRGVSPPGLVQVRAGDWTSPPAIRSVVPECDGYVSPVENAKGGPGANLKTDQSAWEKGPGAGFRRENVRFLAVAGRGGLTLTISKVVMAVVG
jgi:hypothetical protein